METLQISGLCLIFVGHKINFSMQKNKKIVKLYFNNEKILGHYFSMMQNLYPT